ncbi:MAG: ABC-2 family transporter protein [bacterium]|nr:ABC-2 family transporter protein [bacterium]
MKKYWIIFKNSLQTSMAYRFNTFAFLIAELFSLAVIIYLWLSIYRQGNQIGNYTLSSLIIYYIFTKFISLLINAQDTARIIGDSIRQGDIINYLVKPINFQFESFFSNFGAVTYNFLAYSFIFLIILLFFHGISINILSAVLFILFILMAIVINFLINYIIGISTFYLGFIMGINFIMFNITLFLSGSLIPLDMLPSLVYKIVGFLPFKYLAFVPISVVTGKIGLDGLMPLLAHGLFWILALYLVALILYKKGLKNYEAYGG